MNYSSFGINIALAKYPTSDNLADSEMEYIKGITRLIEGYGYNINELLPEEAKIHNSLYKPSIFHLFAHYDVAFVTIIDNFKFSQRVFEPWSRDSNKPNADETLPEDNKSDSSIKSSNYQILSGSILFELPDDEDNQLTKLSTLLNEADKSFTKIVQLKLNNGLLIGNGNKYLDYVIDRIREYFKSKNFNDYVLIDSLNWCELIIIIKGNNLDTITNYLSEIREFSISNGKQQTNIESIITNSLYKEKWKVDEPEIKKCHLFCDSYTYFGYTHNLMNDASHTNPQLVVSEVELQVKPGHSLQLHAELKKIGDFKYSYKHGKTDLRLLRKFDADGIECFSCNLNFYKEIRSKNLLKHVRKVKTKFLFNDNNSIVEEDLSMHSFSIDNNLKKLTIPINKVSEHLSKLTISRSTRKKVRKVLFNYNIGIQDPVMYIYYIDLKNLLEIFKIRIEKSAQNIANISQYCTKKSKELEDEINEFLNIFEEALHDRILNNYNYEEINEFNLDINSSFTSILSSLDSIIKFIGGQIRKEIDGLAMTTSIFDSETVSNSYSVNYNIEQIINPPLVFATLIKEILNQDEELINLFNDNKLFFENFYNLIPQNSKLAKEYEPNTLNAIKNINYWYIIINYCKFYLTFKSDIKLYVFWHWTYFLQNTAMYNTLGNIDEDNFKRELIKLCFIVNMENFSQPEPLNCPIPELSYIWDKYYYIINAEVREIVKNDNFTQKLLKLLTGTLNDKSGNFNIAKKECLENNPPLPNDILQHSFCSLQFIYNKFGGKPALLRRDYVTGNPCEIFIKGNSKKWFIDPFGAFFINDAQERKDYMKHCNQMLNYIWSYGLVVKKELFKTPEYENFYNK